MKGWNHSAFLLLLAPLAAAASDQAIPEYRPEAMVTGVIRCWGCREMGPLLRRWQEGLRRFQPGLWVAPDLKGTDTAMLGLEENVADLALMDRPIAPYDTYGIWRRSHLLPVGVSVATGSLNVPDHACALGIFVQAGNPLAQLTLRQLDQVFGAQRSGGWRGMKWDPSAARSAAESIRTWDRLGLSGEWAGAPIHPYGPPATHPGGMSFFQQRVLHGADTRNEDLREYADPVSMLKALADDRLGIACAEISAATPGVKLLALADRDGAGFVGPTAATVASRSYPLARPIYIYFAPDTPGGEPASPNVEPRVREFLRYVLSREGQAEVARDGTYLPLTAEIVQAGLKKLD